MYKIKIKLLGVSIPSDYGILRSREVKELLKNIPSHYEVEVERI